MSGANESSMQADESQSERTPFYDFLFKVRHFPYLIRLRYPFHRLRDALRVVRRQRFGDLLLRIRHSRIASPLRRSGHGLRNALRAARRHRWDWTLATLRSGKAVYSVDGIEVARIAPSRQFAHGIRNRNRELRRKRKVRKASAALSRLSDGDFILVIAELLFKGRGANPVELDTFKRHLREDPRRRSELIERLLGEHYMRLESGEKHRHDPHSVQIMGTREFLTRSTWDERAAKVGTSKDRRIENRSRDLSGREFKHTGEYVVSAIASLYKGRQYLETFLENITSQTIFDRSELIIIDANSPDGEGELIAEYQKVYPNIVYKRINYRIGIYEAWNDAAEMARGRYLTNTNLDDLRRADSFELQAGALDELKFVDVIYQDFFYSLDSSLGVDDVGKFGFKSSLPVLCANNLLRFNSPHNAPMWRARLHKELGLFDTSFRSAGDYEFWMRCALNGKQFYKLNSPHIVYFQNPEGISTSPETKGVVESRRLMNMYARKLVSPYMTMSRAEFAKELNIEPNWSWDTPLYDVVQSQLERLNSRVQ